MFDFLKPRHLRYRSMEEWRQRENITSFRHPENPRLEARLQRQFEELRRHLWKRHLKQLTPEERKDIKAGKHPSQSHKHIEQARAIFEEFRSRVAGLAYVAEVSMTAREQIAFRVRLNQEMGWRVWHEQIPPFYRGFEVFVLFVPGARPALTKESAATLIPNGMNERDVYAQLGTNATVSHGKNGEKNLTYLFHLNAPPKLDAKIDTMTVVISNGAVVDRQFGQ
ncbi:MAG TPA: hypothetical protein VNU95_06035 [Candidatus Acidoferrales bacterium]|jgi:hypothetical protein|nr:hypothetical protein [Candidatus Acidoferrales bacterium]